MLDIKITLGNRGTKPETLYLNLFMENSLPEHSGRQYFCRELYERRARQLLAATVPHSVVYILTDGDVAKPVPGSVAGSAPKIFH